MKLKKVTALLLSTVLTMSMLAGCGGGAAETAPADTGAADTTAAAETDDADDAADDDADDSAASGDVKEFTMFITMPGSEINDDNEIAQMIADKWGVKVKETWLTGQTASEATGTLIAGDEYPDFIDSDEMNLLIDADALIPLDDYIDQ